MFLWDLSMRRKCHVMREYGDRSWAFLMGMATGFMTGWWFESAYFPVWPVSNFNHHPPSVMDPNSQAPASQKILYRTNWKIDAKIGLLQVVHGFFPAVVFFFVTLSLNFY